MDARLGRLHGIVLVVNGRGRTSQIVNLVDLDVERKGHVVAEQLETLVIEQVLDIAPRTGEEIIGAKHIGAFRQQALAKMRAEEAGSAGHERGWHAATLAAVARRQARHHAIPQQRTERAKNQADQCGDEHRVALRDTNDIFAMDDLPAIYPPR